ncbi:MAG: hypothetical protein IT168_17100 [Bryobacterales bacterium]|nr:hypothetical protein [Bryobacterales bacterium]
MRYAYLLLAFSVFAQEAPIQEIKVATDPSPARIRPLETLVIQVRAYGNVAKADGGSDKVRVQRGGAKARVVTLNGGWLSKPFKYQGKDDEPFYQNQSSRFATIFGALSKDFLLQDAFLYSAPDKPGKYEVEAEIDGKTAKVTVEVSDSEQARKKAEKITFPAETRKPDAYRRLAEHWAPFLAQETWWQPKADIPARFDFDGDWQGDNNWEDMEIGSSQAYVHYAAIETLTHWFLIYNVFHPRDYSDKCIAGTCHENDNEGLILTVRKDGSEFGKLEVMETLAHNNVYSYVNDSRIRGGVHNVEGRIEFYQDSHPIIFVESGGHGIYGSAAGAAKYSVRDDKFTNGTGITFIYKGIAERPRHANDRLVGYELLPIYDHWWQKANDSWRDRTFDEFYVYSAFGGRPSGAGKGMGGTFYGRKEAANKAKPFWGWFDSLTLKKKILNTGQWGLDPAYSVSRNLTFPSGDAFSLEYTYNPYLNIEVTP